MTTDLHIKGRGYDLEATFSNPPINVLIYMQKILHITMQEIVGGLDHMNTALTSAQAARDSGDQDAPSDSAALLGVLYNEESLRAFQGLIWLARTCAGERADGPKFFSLEEAADGIGVADIQFVNEVPPDPTELEAAASPSSSTTSSETSTTTSSSSPTSGPDTRS